MYLGVEPRDLGSATRNNHEFWQERLSTATKSMFLFGMLWNSGFSNNWFYSVDVLLVLTCIDCCLLTSHSCMGDGHEGKIGVYVLLNVMAGRTITLMFSKNSTRFEPQNFYEARYVFLISLDFVIPG